MDIVQPLLSARNRPLQSKHHGQCRSLDGSGTPIQPDEKVIGDQACKAVPVEKAPDTLTMTPAPAQRATPKQDAVPASSASTSEVEVIRNSVFIAPMNSFESYLAAAFEKKKVPVTIVADQARAT